MFHRIYEKAKIDGTVRTDIPENEIFSSTLHLMLAAVTRYAVGLVYDGGTDPEQELRLLKDVLYSRFTVNQDLAQQQSGADTCGRQAAGEV